MDDFDQEWKYIPLPQWECVDYRQNPLHETAAVCAVAAPGQRDPRPLTAATRMLTGNGRSLVTCGLGFWATDPRQRFKALAAIRLRFGSKVHASGGFGPLGRWV